MIVSRRRSPRQTGIGSHRLSITPINSEYSLKVKDAGENDERSSAPFRQDARVSDVDVPARAIVVVKAQSEGKQRASTCTVRGRRFNYRAMRAF